MDRSSTIESTDIVNLELIEQQYMELLHEKQSLRLRCNELKDAYFEDGLSVKKCYREFEHIAQRLEQINDELLFKTEQLDHQKATEN